MRSWTTFRQTQSPNSWDNLQNKPAILSDNQISWNEVQNKPNLLVFNSSEISTELNCTIVSGLLGSSGGSVVSVAHNLQDSFIVAGILSIYYSTSSGAWIPNTYSLTPGYQVDWILSHGRAVVTLSSTNSYNILGRKFKVMLFYLS